MPIVVTFDFTRPRPRELNRLRGVFERLGWERLGNTAYRYPRLGVGAVTEDWFNHVIPVLMLLRTYARHSAATERGVARFTIDATTSTGFNRERGAGTPPLVAHEIAYSTPSSAGLDFGQQQLEDWIDGIEWPYAPDEGAAP